MPQTNFFQLPDIPDIFGLKYRLLNPETDFPGISQVYNTASPENSELIPQSADAVAREYEQQNPDDRQKQLVVEVDGNIIGWGRYNTYHQRSTLTIGDHEFYVLPEWRSRGIEIPALRYFEAQVSELIRKDQTKEAIYKIFINEAETYRINLLKTIGYTQLAAHANMVRPDLENIPDFPLPDGFVIRPAADEHIREIYETYREAFQEHIHGSDASEEDFKEWSQASYLADRSLWIVVWDIHTNKIAGVILNFIVEEENTCFQRNRGYVEFISVLRAYRGLGLARAMITASLRMYKARGMQEAALSCHTENPFNPIVLYLKMGFQTRYHTLVLSKPIAL
ncbi:MAG: hypothetical protein CVU39_15190 [Chloroflexi bacterium HGW-Chloroflexi-10]|nr:MAG: hypothetical protein CVU39_15190 [Chloroflexi bacterium HGW-Chloroflexi-10]